MRMVSHRRRRSILTAFALYTLAALFVGYFGVNAYTGNYGLRAQQDFDQQIAQMNAELAWLEGERVAWQRRVSLLRSDRIDPDMLEERARALLDAVDPREVTLIIRPR